MRVSISFFMHHFVTLTPIMRADLGHLPPQHRADLQRLVELIRSEVSSVQQVILFGSFARGDWKSQADLPPPQQRRSGHASDYDILVVTDTAYPSHDPVLWERLSRTSLQMGLQTHARIIGYDYRTINERLMEGRYFYVDIIREGFTLYDNGQCKLITPQHVPEGKRKEIAGKYFSEGLATASSFYENFEFRMSKDDAKNAAFQLNQAVEAAYKTILLVFTNHSPHEHWLRILSNEAAMHAPSIAHIFPMNTSDDERRFMQLDEAYIAARYDPNFTMSTDDLTILAMSVRTLLDKTKAACEAALKHMR